MGSINCEQKKDTRIWCKWYVPDAGCLPPAVDPHSAATAAPAELTFAERQAKIDALVARHEADRKAWEASSASYQAARQAKVWTGERPPPTLRALTTTLFLIMLFVMTIIAAIIFIPSRQGVSRDSADTSRWQG